MKKITELLALVIILLSIVYVFIIAIINGTKWYTTLSLSIIIVFLIYYIRSRSDETKKTLKRINFIINVILLVVIIFAIFVLFFVFLYPPGLLKVENTLFHDSTVLLWYTGLLFFSDQYLIRTNINSKIGLVFNGVFFVLTTIMLCSSVPYYIRKLYVLSIDDFNLILSLLFAVSLYIIKTSKYVLKNNSVA
ncbi:hypothetical protein KHQ81_11700 [Mycoplasmatota bacterium]|nr:hypothetical protein KHQ81_11700 [Mycoplasmatota bacterium]